MKTWLSITALSLFAWTQSALATSFNIERWQTAKGTPVVFYKADEVPMLYLNVAFKAGSAYDGERFGLSALTAELLNQGNGKYNATQLAEKLADVGAQYDEETTRDMVALQLKTLTKDDMLKESIDAFELILSKPKFGQDVFYRTKNQQMMAIAKAKESPDEVANTVFFNKLYQNHPYGHAINGNKKTVQELNVSQVRNFYKQYYVAKNAVIVMVGAIDSEKAHQIAEQLTHNLPEGKPAADISKASQVKETETINVDFPSSQTVLRLGQLGIDHASADYFALMVGNYILGGGALVSRLPLEVREKHGLTYGISSQFYPMPGNGPFLISLSTKNSQAKKALQLTEETLSDFIKTGPTDEELTAAKQYLVGSFPVSLGSNGSIAGVLLRMSFYHLPDSYLKTYVARIQNVTASDIKTAFAKVVKPESMLLISVGDSKKTIAQHNQHIETEEPTKKV